MAFDSTSTFDVDELMEQHKDVGESQHKNQPIEDSSPFFTEEVDVDTLHVRTTWKVPYSSTLPQTADSNESSTPLSSRKLDEGSSRNISYSPKKKKNQDAKIVRRHHHNHGDGDEEDILSISERVGVLSRVCSLNELELTRHDALLLGMERTFFAALNNAWILVIAGIGLMSVGNNDNNAVVAGGIILCSGLACAGLAFCLHVGRIVHLRRDIPFPLSHSVLWASLIIGVTVTALALELKFGIQYPYLERAAAVTLTNATDAQS